MCLTSSIGQVGAGRFQGPLWLANPTKTASFQLSGRSCLKTARWKVIEVDTWISCCLLCAFTDAHAHARTHSRNSGFSLIKNKSGAVLAGLAEREPRFRFQRPHRWLTTTCTHSSPNGSSASSGSCRHCTQATHITHAHNRHTFYFKSIFCISYRLNIVLLILYLKS